MLITGSRLSSTRDIRLFISFREAMADVQRFDLLDPAEVARFGGIEIVAQGVVEGFLSGIHRSPFRGFSVEFTEHRAYQPGDELRYLDWKILAGADRLFVKQFEQETNLRAMILVDASRSMAWRGAPNRLTKRAYADRLAAALALILLRQRDATGLITFDDVVREVVPARVKAGQWRDWCEVWSTRRTVRGRRRRRHWCVSRRCSPGGGSSYSSPTCCSTVSWRLPHCATCVIVAIRRSCCTPWIRRRPSSPALPQCGTGILSLRRAWWFGRASWRGPTRPPCVGRSTHGARRAGGTALRTTTS